jgi:flagellar basal-body rod protein FlgC
MSMSVDANVSALHALSTSQSVRANNLANSESVGFKKSRTVLEEKTAGGVTASVQRVSTPGPMLLQDDGSTQELSNVDMAEELVGMIPTKHAYEANLNVLRTAEEMDQSTLDLIG